VSIVPLRFAENRELRLNILVVLFLLSVGPMLMGLVCFKDRDCTCCIFLFSRWTIPVGAALTASLLAVGQWLEMAFTKVP